MKILIELTEESFAALVELARREDRKKTAMARILLTRAIEEAIKC
jgi:hypothetical protein